MNYLYLANIVSFTPLLIYFYLLCNSLYTKNIKSFKLSFYIFLSNSLVDLIKKINFPKKYDYIFKRPKDACDCDYLSSNGIQKNRPGFPSGHMTTTSFFCIYQIMNSKNKCKKMLYVFVILLMGWARYYKNCHNLVQIITGTFLGSLIGYGYRYIE